MARDYQTGPKKHLAVRDYSQLSPEELFSVCVDGANQQAWEEFVRRFHPLIVSVALRLVGRYTAASRSLIEDFTQAVYLKLNDQDGRLLRTFEPRHAGSAYGFIKVLTANVVHDYFRSHCRVRLEETPPASLPATDRADRRLLEREIDDLLSRYARGNERQIFWLYYRQGLTAREIAALPDANLKVKGVESLLRRLKGLIQAEFAAKPAGLCVPYYSR